MPFIRSIYRKIVTLSVSLKKQNKPKIFLIFTAQFLENEQESYIDDFRWLGNYTRP
jgi:hypothetical protein